MKANGKEKGLQKTVFALSKGRDDRCVCRGHRHPTVLDDAHCPRALVCVPLGRHLWSQSEVSRAEATAALGVDSVRCGESVGCLWSEQQPGAEPG